MLNAWHAGNHVIEPAYWVGLSLGFSLILAIGAQNAFVLKQGLLRKHVFVVCITCALSDAILISAGVAGFQETIHRAPWLYPLLRYGGAAFLLWYGGKSFMSALRNKHSLRIDGASSDGLGRTLLMCLSLTWLNPHVYLDTLGLIGAISTRYQDHQLAFALGAISASFLFFFSLGYGAALLRPLLQSRSPGEFSSFRLLS